MPDITMCKGGSCSIKETCYRFKVIPNPARQSYFSTPPFIIEKNSKIDCKYYEKTNI